MCSGVGFCAHTTRGAGWGKEGGGGLELDLNWSETVDCAGRLHVHWTWTGTGEGKKEARQRPSELATELEPRRPTVKVTDAAKRHADQWVQSNK